MSESKGTEARTTVDQAPSMDGEEEMASAEPNCDPAAMTEPTPTAKPIGVGFRMTLTAKKPRMEGVVANRRLVADNDRDGDDREAIEDDGAAKRTLVMEDGVVKDDSSKKSQKKLFVIPAQRAANDWRIERLKKIVDEGGASDEDRARLALLTESLGGDGGNEGPLAAKAQSADANGIVIEAIKEPGASDIVEADEADYDEVPIGEFGLAFLRGWGWREEEGIGRTNKRAVKMQVSKPRPKGLGLGADVSKFEQRKASKNGKESTSIKVRSRVRVLAGAERNCYGIVRSLDEDNGGAFVEMDVSKRIIRISQYNLELLASSRDEKKPSPDTGSDERGKKRKGTGSPDHGQRDREKRHDYGLANASSRKRSQEDDEKGRGDRGRDRRRERTRSPPSYPDKGGLKRDWR